MQCQSDVQLQENQLIDYFGEIYASDPSNFRFVIGDKKLIRLVRDHLIKNQNEKGAKYLQRFRKKTDRKNEIHRAPNTELRTNIDNTNDNIDHSNVAFSAELSASLLERLKIFMKSFEIDASVVENMTQNSVSVKIVNGIVAAEIFCALCRNDTVKKRKLTGKKVFLKEGTNSKYWVLSNFKEHLKTVHKVTCSRSKEDHDSSDVENTDPNRMKKKMLQLTKLNDAKETKKNNQMNFDLAMASTSKEENIASDHNFSVEYVNVMPSDVQQPSDNRSQLMFDQISAQITKILSETLHNNDKTEQMAFELIENVFHFSKVASINPNGACVFGAIAHQLEGQKINSDEHVQATKRIRVDVVNYISSHYSSFQRELRNRVYDEVNPKSITDLDKECKIILNDYLPLNNYWGGAETLKAVREIHQVNILILNERGTCHFFNDFNEQYKRTLILAYRLEHEAATEIDTDSYNHYDSVCDILSDGILQIIDILIKRAQKKNMKFNDTL